ncbi:Na/Pi cotransporter family protein [Bacillus sp. FJAT-45350]|uniref:Na/Pi cotransporter family protein n=1 Tax=Bacillus sp. FJAT-45350 TaxID=2011014 RepID=UPI000BB8D640|nr:Na/Pi symporter [Bacillus sp. FJAT-45350]
MGTFSVVIGGIGLFLLGMTLMTDGLKALAGDALKRLLSKFTGGTFSAIFSGASITALIQSSSATTFMTIGFVSAGLLTFTQSIGVILGANLGSTSTGWIVSMIGFKVNMGVIALPLIGIGVFLKLFSKGKFAPHGMALAGFGLLFLGIDVLQQGMADVGDMFNLAAISGDSFLNKIILIFIGIAMTVVMQSSSAAVVTTLTALYTGAITFDQAAVLVIGQNVGTTVKAAIASIGSSVPAKRTAVAHILFNLLTGLVAFIALPLLVMLVFRISDWMSITDLSVSLAIFHTVFNVIGILLIVPFIGLFSKMVMKIIPDKGDSLTKHLDPSVATVTPVAIEASRRTLKKVTNVVVSAMIDLLKEKKMTATVQKKLDSAEAALVETRQFLSTITTDFASSTSRQDYKNHVAAIHAIDHLDRLIKATKETDFLVSLETDENLTGISSRMKVVLADVTMKLKDIDIEELVQIVEENSASIAEARKKDRKRLLKKPAKNQVDVDTAIQKVHTLHWIDRLAYHLWRAIFHLQPYDEKAESDVETIIQDETNQEKAKQTDSY